MMKKHIILGIMIWAITSPLFSQLQFYSDIAGQLGIHHTYGEGLPGAGISLADFNNDGWDDLTLATQSDSLLFFYQNDKGVLKRIPAPIDNRDEVKQVLWADFDNDGDQDLFVTCYDAPNRLFEQQGDFIFTDITEAANLPLESRLSYGASFVDFNRDGWLDIYLCERLGPDSADFNKNRLFKNMANGTFIDISTTSGAENLGRKPFCATFFDYDGDKWPDLYIANDRNSGNILYRNLGNETFIDESESAGADLVMNAMCVAIGDYNLDARQDIYVTNTEEGNALLTNEGDGTFVEQAGEKGVAFNKIGWASNFLDGDNDGDLDLYVSGILRSDTALSSFYYKNENGVFNHLDEGFLGDTATSYTNAIGDFDRDGRLEIVVSNHAPYTSTIWRDGSPNSNHFIAFDLEGVLSNRDGIGSLVEIFSSGQQQIGYSHCGEGFLGQNSKYIHFGTGDRNRIDTVRITWPTGHVDRLYDIDVDQHVTVTEGSTTNGIISVDPDIDLLVTDLTNYGRLTEDFFTIFPNPATSTLQLDLTSLGKLDAFISHYEIIDATGRHIQTGMLEKDRTIPISGLGSGTYFLVLHSHEGRYLSQFVKF